MNRKELLKALLYVKPGIATKNSIESMMYFYFSGENVVSYNDAISIAYPLKTDFSAFINADHFFKIVSKLTSEEVHFKMEGDILKMRSGKNLESTFSSIIDESVVNRINTVQESLEGMKKETLPSDFSECISLCSHVASKNESDQTLTCLKISGDSIISTDNTRIAHAKMKSPMKDMLLRASEMKSLIAIQPVWYVDTKSWVHFIGESGCMFSIRSVKGVYPDMMKFMDFKGTTISLPKKMLEGIDAASVFTDDENPSINIAIKGGVCRVFKKSSGGKVDFRTPIDYKGSTEINFNIHHDLLREMMAYSTEITVADSKSRLSSGNFTMVTSFFLN